MQGVKCRTETVRCGERLMCQATRWFVHTVCACVCLCVRVSECECVSLCERECVS